jgi:hypothetical protein
MKNFPQIGVQIPQVYLPRQGIDLTPWAVVACDQFTSEPDYWEAVRKFVDAHPSTFNMILPEIYIGTPEEEQRTFSTQAYMRQYLQTGLLQPYEGLIYVVRSVSAKTRHGLLLCLDLERYDYNKGAQSLIRATEGTIIERLPPRMRIREKALLELPHILVLIDDPKRTVIEPLGGHTEDGRLTRLYDFDLMMDSGHLSGFQVTDPILEERVIKALELLADPQEFARKYAVGADKSVLLFAMGDGNHSLATAKAIWEKLKPEVGLDHPARYALVEIENVHDQGLEFEPIHRVLFGLKKDITSALQAYYGKNYAYTPCEGQAEMVAKVQAGSSADQVIGVVQGKSYGTLRIQNPSSNLAVGTLQSFLDAFVKDGGAGKIDYVHGAEVVSRLASQTGNAGFFLPRMDKNDLFKTVILDGALPRKTFSMGEAKEKRFYMECRRIA